jgi:hypothetical protein
LPLTEPALYSGNEVEITTTLAAALGLTSDAMAARVDSSGNVCANPGTTGCYDAVIDLDTPGLESSSSQGYYYRSSGTQTADK